MPPLGRDERAELDAHKSSVVGEVKEITQAAIAHVERVVAPFQPLAQDVAQLKTDTAKQTPIIERLDKRSRRADAERKRRTILDEQKRHDAAKWRKRWRAGLAVLGALVAAAELYRAIKGP